jgi:hypothetical protein
VPLGHVVYHHHALHCRRRRHSWRLRRACSIRRGQCCRRRCVDVPDSVELAPVHRLTDMWTQHVEGI